jgi:hypothetical protein
MEQIVAGSLILALLFTQRRYGPSYLGSFALAAGVIYGVASLFHGG